MESKNYLILKTVAIQLTTDGELKVWIPASAGMTEIGRLYDGSGFPLSRE